MEENVLTDEKIDSLTKVWRRSGLMILMGLIIGGMGFWSGIRYEKYINGKNVGLVNIYPTPDFSKSYLYQPTYTPGPPNPTLPPQEYISLSGRYKLAVDMDKVYDEEGLCPVSIIDSEGKHLDTEKLLGKRTIRCSMGEGVYTDFVKWAHGDKLMIKADNSMWVYDVPRGVRKEYPNPPKCVYIDTDDDLKYWMYQKFTGADLTGFGLYNEEGKLIKELDYGRQIDGYWTALYDKVNKGFVIVTEKPEKAGAGEQIGTSTYRTQFDFLFMKDLRVETLATTGPYILGGRSCNPGKVKSILNEVIIEEDNCIFTPDGFRKADGSIRLKILGN